ncbi:Mediator of RNA polymerase II transcription subunit 11 [Platanthera zijinensis]|uniref:Mediator of RNA polymerase II transcription subunit 11 n=1 Tax=Platanthera zijinensis TaxID=2320716 RepID=A0AAP0ATV2_9ASPA
MLGPQNQSTSLQRLNHAEKMIVHALELSGLAMDELANSTGPRTDVLAGHCGEFMQSMKEIQTTLREEIKSACDYRPFEKCDYGARISNEICCQKLEYIAEQLDRMKKTIVQFNDANLTS